MRNVIILTALLCAACSNYSANLPSIKPYKMDVQQGNVVTSKMMMQLRPGMTKSQVRFVMGTPLITDSFHANRWDYVYRMQKDGKLIESRRVILEFENDQLKRVRGDVIPAEGGTDTAATARPANEPPRSIKPAMAPKKKGVLDTLMFWKDDEKKMAVPAETKPVTAPAETPAKPAAAPTTPAVDTVQPAAEPEKKEKGVLESLKFWKDDESKPAPEPQTAPKALPVPKAIAPTEPKPAAVAAPVPTPAQEVPAKTELKSAPKPEVELPPEEDPGYFERMLEKIGF